MNKLMYLFDFEFKRNISNYSGLIFGFCFLFVIDLIDMLRDYNYVISQELKGKSLELLTSDIGSTSFHNVLSLYDNADGYFVPGIIACIGYSIIIWRKDFVGKSKSIYTLAMLPQDRMKIYMSKFLNILALVYMYVISFTIVLYISYLIIPYFMEGDVKSIGFINDTIHQFSTLIPYNIEMFVVVYVFGITAVITTIFTFMISKKGQINIFKVIGMFIMYTILIFISSIFIYDLERIIINILGDKSLNISICIISSIIIVINLIISKIKLSKIDF